MRLFPVLCALVLLCSGCGGPSLLARQDYQRSQQDFMRGDAAGALLDFPRGERGDFITTMEKGSLSLIQGKPQIRELRKQALLLEDRVRYHVSREARTFFYVQTPEDYYASEHEVIWLHFLLSWGYSLQGKYEDACVEAREAASLLALPWSPTGRFDDPMMRLFLAGLWTMCGDWQDAQVDLRAAWFMDNKLTWARDLAQRDQPPRNLFLVLGGPGPEVEWNPELGANPLRSGRQVSFRLRGQKSRLTIFDRSGQVIDPYLSPDASPWYARHLERESELHDLILDSTYGGKAAVSGAKAGGMIAATTGVGLAIGLGGTALGAAIIYHAGSDSAVEAGLAIIASSIAKGTQVSKEGYAESTSEFRQELDPSTGYRFVRYLPEYLWMGWSDRPLAYPVELHTPAASVFVEHPTVGGQAAVTLAFIPDVPRPALSW
jgi:hypothetical protein